MSERMKRQMTAAVALKMLQYMDRDDSDAGDLLEVESDSNVSWILDPIIIIIIIMLLLGYYCCSRPSQTSSACSWANWSAQPVFGVISVGGGCGKGEGWDSVDG